MGEDDANETVFVKLQSAVKDKCHAEAELLRVKAELDEYKTRCILLKEDNAHALATLEACKSESMKCKKDLETFLKDIRNQLDREKRNLEIAAGTGGRMLPWESELNVKDFQEKLAVERSKRQKLLVKIKKLEGYSDLHDRFHKVEHDINARAHDSKRVMEVQKRFEKEIFSLKEELIIYKKAMEESTCNLSIVKAREEKRFTEQRKRYRDQLKRADKRQEELTRRATEEAEFLKESLAKEKERIEREMERLKKRTKHEMDVKEESVRQTLQRKELETKLKIQTCESASLHRLGSIRSSLEKEIESLKENHQLALDTQRTELETEFEEKMAEATSKHRLDLEELVEMHEEKRQQLVESYEQKLEDQKVQLQTKNKSKLKQALKERESQHSLAYSRLETELENAKAERHQEVKTLRKDYERQIENLKEQHDASVQELKKQLESGYSAGVQALNYKTESEVQTIKREHKEQIEQLRQSYEHRLQEQRLQLIESNKADVAHAQQERDLKHKSEMMEIQNNFDKELTAAKTGYEQNLSQMKANQKQEMASLQQSVSQQVQQMKRKMEKEFAQKEREIESRLLSELEALGRIHDERQQETRIRLETELEEEKVYIENNSKLEMKKVLKEQELAFLAEKLELENRHQQHLQEVRTQHQKQMDDQLASLERREVLLKNQLEAASLRALPSSDKSIRLQEKLERLEAVLEIQNEKHVQEINKLREKVQFDLQGQLPKDNVVLDEEQHLSGISARTESMKEKYLERISKEQTLLFEQIQACREGITNLQQAVSPMASPMGSPVGSPIGSPKSPVSFATTAEADTFAALWRQSNHAAQYEHEREVGMLRAEINEQRVAYEKTIAELQISFEEQTIQMKNAHKEELTELQRESQSRAQSIRDELETKFKSQVSELEKEMENLKLQHEETLASLRVEHEEMIQAKEAEIAELLQKHGNDLETMESELNAQSYETLQKQEISFRRELEEQAMSHQKALKEVKASMRAKQSSEFCKELDTRDKEFSKRLEEERQHERERFHKELDIMKEKAAIIDNEHKQALQRVEKGHHDELQKLELNFKHLMKEQVLEHAREMKDLEIRHIKEISELRIARVNHKLAQHLQKQQQEQQDEENLVATNASELNLLQEKEEGFEAKLAIKHDEMVQSLAEQEKIHKQEMESLREQYEEKLHAQKEKYEQQLHQSQQMINELLEVRTPSPMDETDAGFQESNEYGEENKGEEDGSRSFDRSSISISTSHRNIPMLGSALFRKYTKSCSDLPKPDPAPEPPAIVEVTSPGFKVGEFGDWEEYIDRETGDSFWFNIRTQHVTKTSPKVESPRQPIEVPTFDPIVKNRRREIIHHMSEIHIYKQKLEKLRSQHEEEVFERLEKQVSSRSLISEEKGSSDDGDEDHHEQSNVRRCLVREKGKRPLSMKDEYRIQKAQERQFAFDHGNA